MLDSYVCSGAMMQCTMGTKPAQLTVLPARTVFLAGQPQANISDHVSMANLAPFGLCRSLAFPPTAAATAAALGTLTPMPCIHNTPAPWFVGKMDTLIQGQPALLKSCKCQCMWGGTISLITDGQMGEGTQWVQKKSEVKYPQPQAQFIEPKTVTHIWQPVNSGAKTMINEIQHQVKDSTVTFGKSIKQQVSDIPDQKPVDTIILWDAYWEKTLEKDNQPQEKPTKLRFIPQQQKVDLFVVFYFEHEKDETYDKDKAEFALRFDVPDTQYVTKEYNIKGIDILSNVKPIVTKEHSFYTCTIKNFSSDLTEAVFPDYFKEKE